MAPTDRSARTELLRDLLVRVVAVAREVDADGRAPVPGELRRVLGMARLTPRALAAADRAGDDAAFRAEVVAALPEDGDGAGLDEAARLWLDRPDGWEARLAEMVEARVDEVAEGDARRALADERRRRERADAELARVRSDLAAAEDRIARLVEERDDLEARVEGEVARAEAAVAERTRAVRELKGVEARHARLHDEVRELRAARPQAVAPPEPVVAPEPDPPTPPVEELDRDAAGRAVRAAAEAAAALAGSLGELATTLGGEAPTRADPPTVTEPRGPRRTPRPAPRRPVGRLPGGLHDDAPEAADHLVHLPACALLVDGYNATMATWPGRSLPEQRGRLIAALDELEARVGVEVTVVFDGVEERWGSSASRRVHVHFTPSGTEADDVILDLVDVIAGDRPVVVASDDRRVRDGARRRGAHVIGIDQLRSLVT